MKKKIRDGLSNLPPLLDTQVSGHLDKEGELNIRGYELIELAKKVTFEEVAYLLLYKKLPNLNELNTFNEILFDKNQQCLEISSNILKTFKGHEHPIYVITSCFAAISSIDCDPIKRTDAYLINKAISTIALYSVILAIHISKRTGNIRCLDRIDSSNFTESFVERCFGNKNVTDKAHYLDILLVLASDQALAASTFGARIAASTRSSFFSSIIAGINTWNGYRHGAASEYAFKDLIAIKAQGGNVEEYYQKRKEEGISPFGFGHRRYKKIKDPRAIFLESLTREIYEKYGGSLYETAQEAVYFWEKQKGIYANPDLYVAVMLESLGFLAEEVSSVVFMGRLAGLSAHIMEENGPMRPLLRGEALYTGKPIGPIVPIEER